MKIVLASNNAKKLIELQAVLPSSYELSAAGEYDSPEETGTTFVENAIIKARYVSELTGSATLADDSGLEIDYLKGQPGIYSSRFAGEGASDEDNNQKLLEVMEDVPESKRQARFRCVIVYLRFALDPMPIIASGTWEGVILNKARGTNGFGYDPLFFLPDLGLASAELSAEQKNQLSHRSQAIAELHNLLTQEAS